MSLSATVITGLIAGVEHTSSLPVPAIVYGLVSAAVFALMGFVIWSFRDVANRHSHKTSGPAPHGTDHH